MGGWTKRGCKHIRSLFVSWVWLAVQAKLTLPYYAIGVGVGI